ncbi:MAG: hypothetical protein K0S33_353 [Bacteroidetes bacterium]|jgi:hypothetical protein|nr:hypothetical protein [Bacteroidota bacterium]
MSLSFENNRFTLLLNEAGYYELSVADNIEITVEDVKAMVEVQKKLGGERLPTLVATTSNAILSTDTMSYISKNVNFPYSKAGAYVVSSSSQKMLSNFYLKLKHPERPTKFFNNREEAVKWIMEQKEL